MEEKTVITYETLYEILRKEKTRPELQKLDETFFQSLLKYIEEKKEILYSQQNKESIFTSLEVQKTRKQLENVQRIVKELYEKRESKIIKLATIHSRAASNPAKDTDLMLKEEIRFYTQLLDLLNDSRSGVLNNLLKGKEPMLNPYKPKDLKTAEKPQISGEIIKFIDNIPEFVGTDMKTYGPFKKEEEKEIPQEIADLLVNRKKAIKIK